MDRTTPCAHRQRMAQLVQCLDDRVAEPQQQEVARGQHVHRGVDANFLPVASGRQGGAGDEEKPGNETERVEEPARVRRQPVEQVRWIEQRHTKGQRIEGAAAAFARTLVAPREHMGGVRRGFRLQQVVLVEAMEHANDFILGRGVLAECADHRIPHLLHAARAVEPADEGVGRGVDPVVTTGASILENEPGLAAIDAPLHAHMAAQPRVQPGDAVPGRTEDGLAHRQPSQDQALRRSQSMKR